MRIIDIHAHVFTKVAGLCQGVPMSSLDYGRVTVGNDAMQLMPPSFRDSTSPVEMLLAHMEDAGVEKALLMANPFYGYHNPYLEECSRRYEGKLKGIALVDVLKGKQAADELERYFQKGILTGLKFEIERSFQFAPEMRLKNLLLAPIFECCAAYGQPVFIHMLRPCDIRDVKELAKRYPDTSFILCHLGADACYRNLEKGMFEEFLEMVGEYSNLYTDTSTVPEYFEEEYPFPQTVSYIERAWKVLGPEKLMWASDYPGMLKMATYKQLIHIVLNGCGEIPLAHKELIMGENADRLFFGASV